MQFDLISNPFAILDLTGEADAGAISARARELATAEAMAASRSLLVPRTRLQAELRYLPGASPEIARECLSALRASRQPDLWALAPLARTNVLAHLAANKSATDTQLRDLAGLQDAIRETADAAINNARVSARMAPVATGMLEQALDDLAKQHAEAFCDGALALATGSELFVEQIKRAGTEPTARASFLRQASAAWERATSGETARYLEEALPIEEALGAEGAEAQARRLAALILRFAERTKPRREACRTIGLHHEESEKAVQRWRTVALDLNNRQDAIQEAVIVLEALVSGFETADELGMRTARDLDVCRERLSKGEGTPEWRRLVAAINAATEATASFQRCEMVDGHPTPTTPSVVRELHDAFIEATKSPRSDLPWRVLRAFTLRLHNEFSSTEAALAFTRLALQQYRGATIAVELGQQLERDARSLRSQILRGDLTAATNRKDRGALRQILAELIPLTEDAKEKSDYQSALATLNRRQAQGRGTGLFYALVAVAAIAYFATHDHGTSRVASRAGIGLASTYSASGGTYPYPAAQAGALPVTSQAVDPDAGKSVQQPSAGSATLARSELRWCLYQSIRADAAREYLENARAEASRRTVSFNAAVEVFNHLIETLNSSCYRRNYVRSDRTVVDADVAQHSVDLRTQGQLLVSNALNPAVPVPPPTPSYTVSPASSNPVPAPAPERSPGAPMQRPQPFGQGLADRQNWEAWLNAQSGPYRDGAAWWASVRSTTPTPSCEDAPGTHKPAVLEGCKSAQIKLFSSDTRRRTEPDYRSGWNSFIDPATRSRAFTQGVADRQAWEAWTNSLTGAFRDGAEWWASVRSMSRPSVCSDVPAGLASEKWRAPDALRGVFLE